ncbi:MAG TPA: hypothetical protein H9887_08965, partial [Candidatus Dorea intestinavium]|nr:hypothetical protein [Candidatus Dorea intestinavium]
ETGPLPKMAARRLRHVIEQGAFEESWFEKIKSICMIALRNEKLDVLIELLPVYATILQINEALRMAVINDLTLLSCLAVKNAQPEVCKICTKVILSTDDGLLADELFAERTLEHLKNILIAAARARDEATFVEVMSGVVKFYSVKTLIKNEQQLKDFFIAILFAAADHRWISSLKKINNFFVICIERNVFTLDIKKKIVYEWVQLIGQMARRNWTETAQELMHLLFAFVGKSRNEELTMYGITLMSSSMKMHASWDGMEKAFQVYYPWQIAVLVLIDRFVKDQTSKNREVARYALRAMRDFAMHVARLSINRQETEVFLQWQELWEKAKPAKHIAKRAGKLLQMVVLYWEQLQPKASRNQLPHLMKILQPNLIDEKSRALLNE